jgi:hypothetical protein
MHDIDPYVGIGSLYLGMASRDVVNCIGLPVRERIKKGRKVYTFDDCRLSFSKCDELEEIELFSNFVVGYKGESVFKNNGVLKKMIHDDGAPVEIFGTVLLLTLGVSFWGFDEAELDVRTISLFRKGYWDDYREKLKTVDIDELQKAIIEPS